MPSNPDSLIGKKAEWVWQQCFIWMIFFMALGILMLVAVIGSTGRPSIISAVLLLPLAVLVYCAGSLVYHKLSLSFTGAASASSNSNELYSDDESSVLSDTDENLGQDEEED